jgi:hypothetical protein
MKKLSLILVLLLAVGLAAFAGEPSVSGTLGTQIAFDDGTDVGNIGKLRLNVAFPVGDFVNVTMDLRHDEAKNTASGYNGGLEFNQVYATTDVSGIFGISDMVAITLTTGIYEQWMSNWNSATPTNRARPVEKGWDVGGPDKSADIGLDFGIGDFGTLMAYVDTEDGYDGIGYKFGFRLGSVVPGLNLVASYTGADYTDIAGSKYSYFKADAGYSLEFGDGMSVAIPVAFLMDLEAETMEMAFGVKFSGMGLSAGVGAMMEDVSTGDLALSVLDIALAYAIMDTGVSIYVNAFTAPSEDVNSDFMESLDFGLSYDLAGNMIYVGYVADLGDNVTNTKLMMDDSDGRHGIQGDGFYIVNRISF